MESEEVTSKRQRRRNSLYMHDIYQFLFSNLTTTNEPMYELIGLELMDY